MTKFSDATWKQIEELRGQLTPGRFPTVAATAQSFVETLAVAFPSTVLARLFVVVPLQALPAADRAHAEAAARGDARLRSTTRVLSLLGTTGRDPQFCDRQRSVGHLAVPLLDSGFVGGIPMIAKLLSDLEVDFAGLDEGRAIASQKMLGGRNGKFVVPDAATAKDAQQRFIIPARDFVDRFRIRTVFGMGGAYVDGTLAIAVVFTDELIAPLAVDRFPSLISNFKMATTAALQAGHIYA